MVTVTTAELLVRYPELEPIHCDHPELLAAVLAESSAFVAHDQASEAKTKALIMAKTAQAIAQLPCGRMAGFSDGEGGTKYDAQVQAMLYLFGPGVTVV